MTSSKHPSEQALVDFVTGNLDPTTTRGVVRHLLAGCDECRGVTSRFWPPRAEEYDVDNLGLEAEALRSRERLVAEDRQAASRLFDELCAQPTSRRTLLVLNSSRFRNWFLTEKVLGHALELGFDDPAEGLAYAELGAAMADRLPDSKYEAGLVADMRARAWGVLANSRRINSDFTGAREGFRAALEHLERGTGDPVEEARICGWKARYMMAMREFKESVRLYDRAIAIYRRVGDDHERAKMLNDKGVTLSSADEVEAAIRCNERALELLDPERDPRMVLAIKHNLTGLLKKRGDVDQAMSLLQEILPLFAKQKDAMILLRLRWLEGCLAQAQGQNRRAEDAFREVQRGFLEREIPFEAAAVSLNLASVLLDEGRFEELKELAAQIVTVFRAFGVQREVLAALELFHQAVEAQKITASWIAEIIAYLEQSRANPGVPFEPSQ